MIRNEVIKRILKININPIRLSSSQINIKKLESEQESSTIEVTENEEAIQMELELEKKRNKSRLKDADYKMLHEENPYPEPTFWHHGSLKYMRRTYGRYGAASGVDPSICWPVKEELEEAKEYERVKYPYTIPQVIAEARARKEEKAKARIERQQDIVNKIQKLEQWKTDLQAKIDKKEGEALAAKMRKERLIEEVRRHFGYKVDPKDDRFKEMLEKKEKEEKKAMKEARKKAREEKVVKKLLFKGEQGKEKQSAKKADKPDEVENE